MAIQKINIENMAYNVLHDEEGTQREDVQKLADFREIPIEWLLEEGVFYAKDVNEMIFMLETVGGVNLEEEGYSDDLLNKLVDRYVIPVRNSSGHLVRLVGYDMTGLSGVKYKNITPEIEEGVPRFKKMSYYHFGSWIDFDKVVVIEGFFDGMRLYHSGFNVFCVFSNKISEGLHTYLQRYKKLIVVNDDDPNAQGRNVYKSIAKITKMFVEYPPILGAKDSDELAKKYPMEYDRWVRELKEKHYY